MTNTAPQAILLADYQPTVFATTDTELTFDIGDGLTEVTCRQRVLRRDGSTEPADLVLDGQDMTLVQVAIDDRPLSENEYQLDTQSLTLFSVPADANVTVVTRIVPEENTALEGLYKSGGMYCTQCEAEGFRKITYYQDRPDVLARFTTHLIADGKQYPVMLANGNCISDSDSVSETAQGRRRVTWEDPHPKPSYLFALVAGDLARIEDQFVTASGRAVTLQIYSEPHNIDQCDYAMDALKRSMRWDEQRYGREYDLDIFMIVAVDDFNMGAMENKGLNIFNTSCVLAAPDTATDAAYQRVEAVVAHEYFHNWSGNRVTCRDWFQLSLKEGFTVFRDAQFSSDMNGATAKRIDDVSLLRSVQFAEDAGPLAHPIRPESYIEISNFYTPTIYEKGAEVVGMLHTVLGPQGFRKGSDRYFDEHDGAAATTEDFVVAMEQGSGVALDQFRLWYSQAGTPQLVVQSDFAAGTLTLTLEQRLPATPGQPTKAPMHIPITLGLIGANNEPLALAALKSESDSKLELRDNGNSLLLHLRSETSTLRFSGLSGAPEVSFLRGFSAPVRVQFPRQHEALAQLARHDTDGFARWDALQTLVVEQIFAMVTDAALATPDATVALFGDLIDEALATHAETEAQSVLANMLSLPTEQYLFEQAAQVDAHGIVGARDRFVSALADGLQPRWQALYERNAELGPFAPTPLAMAHRALRSASLTMLGAASGAGPRLSARTCVQQQLSVADNLTDRRAALLAVVNSTLFDATERAELLAEFYERWSDQALVVNLWLQLQASAPMSTAADVQALEAHVCFDQRNPNKVRSLIGAFAQNNARNFHALDGSGYRYL
ncbi:MAG: aminopeptidase N, partial [Pseudomonadales bacterium]